MVELFSDINESLKYEAAAIWGIASKIKDARKAAKYLNDSIALYRDTHTEEEVDFLDFYFQMQMEMVKDEANNNFER